MADAGARTKLVTIEQLTASAGASGFPVESWTLLATMYASRTEVRTGVVNEGMTAAHMVSAPFQTEWALPYRSDIDPELVDVTKVRRLVYQGRVHDIVHGQVLGQQRSVLVQTLAKAG